MIPSLLNIKKTLSDDLLSNLPPLNIVILRNLTIEPIRDYLCYFAYKMKFNAQVRFGSYDNILQESIDGQGKVITNETDYVLVFVYLETLAPDLTCNFVSLSKCDTENEKLRIKEYISAVLNGIRKQTDAVVLWHSFEASIYPAFGILDAQMHDGQSELIKELNRILRTLLKDIGNAYLIDINLCLTRLGKNEFYDRRYWHIAKSPYSRSAQAEIAFEDFKAIRALKGKNKKCLVLDCDNVLWGGIIGEDGLSGIKLSKSYPGSIYYELQKEIVNLYNKGIIIALCSKNNEGDVWDVFQNHPDMVLKEKHIAAFQINWNDKVANLNLIAENLNIGTDSMVFVDDSEFEINLVQRVMPEIEIIHFAKGEGIHFREMLASCGLFDTLSFSAEDQERGAMYKSEAKRKNLMAKTVDMESYFNSLNMKVDINLADEFNIPRIAQLTQKTNQFNLTTKRYTETDIKNLADNPNSEVIYLKLQDRFGDMGIVGVCIIILKKDVAVFDTFLLSCRILGRKVEDVFLDYCLKLCCIKGANLATGQYLPTKKNMQVKDFYQKRGFKLAEEDKTKILTNFVLTDFEPKPPDFFRSINLNIE